MGKYLAAIPVILFPYFLLAAIGCLYSPTIMETVFSDNGYLVLLSVILFGAVCWVFAALLALYILLKKADAVRGARLAMTVKLAQIPAYIAIFVLGTLYAITIFGLGFAAFFVITDCISVAMTGLIGAAAVARAYLCGRLTIRRAVVLAVLQFVFVADVVASVVLFLNARPQPCADIQS